MFGVDSTEFLLVAVVALVVIGPKELPRLMRTLGYWVGKVRGTVGHFRSGIDAMIRESELQEMEKKWRAENADMLKDFPTLEDVRTPADPYLDVADPYQNVSDDSAPELPLGEPAAPAEPKPELP